MGKLSAFRSDPKRESEGVWVDYEDPELVKNPIRFKICSVNRPEYQEELRRQLRPHRKKLRRGVDKIPGEVLRDAQQKAASKWLLTDWENMEDDQGQPIPYSHQTAFEILSDPRYTSTWYFVFGVANDEGEYLEEQLEEDVGN